MRQDVNKGLLPRLREVGPWTSLPLSLRVSAPRVGIKGDFSSLLFSVSLVRKLINRADNPMNHWLPLGLVYPSILCTVSGFYWWERAIIRPRNRSSAVLPTWRAELTGSPSYTLGLELRWLCILSWVSHALTKGFALCRFDSQGHCFKWPVNTHTSLTP